MSHLDAERLLELGLEPELELTAEEAAHVAGCPSCACELEAERQLTANIVGLPRPSAPVGFVAQTTARYQRALATRRARRTAWSAAAALLVGNVAALALVGLAVLNGPAVAQTLAGLLQEVVVLGHAFVVVASKLPIVPVMLTGAVCTTVLVLSTGLGRLALAGAEAN